MNGSSSAPRQSSPSPAHLNQQPSFHPTPPDSRRTPDPTLPLFDSASRGNQLGPEALNATYAIPGDLQFGGTQNDQFFPLDPSLGVDPSGGSYQDIGNFQYTNLSNDSNGFVSGGLQEMDGQDGLSALGYTNQSLNQPTGYRQAATLDPHNLAFDNLLDLQQRAQSPIGPSTHQSNNSNMSSHSPSLSPHHSPSPSGSAHGQPMRPRNVSQSLDPSSAAFPQGYPLGNTWGSGSAFRTHQRQPSDTVSEYSSHSNQASPYLAHLDSFETQAHVSPLLGAQPDNILLGDTLNSFSINDSNLTTPDSFNPSQSFSSSSLLPPDQQPLPNFTSTDNFGLRGAMPTLQHQSSSMTSFGQSAFPDLDTTINAPEGQADLMSPPEINIDFAPPSRQSSFGPRPRSGSGKELAPPDCEQSPGTCIDPFTDTLAVRRKGRDRSHSDPFHGSRPTSPAFLRGRSPSLQPGMHGGASLSPAAIQLPSSTSTSPSRNRSNSSASDNRQYLLDLADPERPTAGPGGEQKRQKHAANYQCHLCVKRFTRAYNLRSHLRTHTNERPFVCKVCGKAFARQHDRKRHEGLHSGEKKFVCRGTLRTDQQWGCGRKFARADALGRHFRSEAGRECIKPLLEEEREERQRADAGQQGQHAQQPQQMQDTRAGFVPSNVAMMDQSQYTSQLPAVLLQMYPDLANFDLSSVSDAGIDDDYVTGRSSFEASEGGESYLSDNDLSVYDPMEMGEQQQQQDFNGLSADWGQQQQQQQPQ